METETYKVAKQILDRFGNEKQQQKPVEIIKSEAITPRLHTPVTPGNLMNIFVLLYANYMFCIQNVWTEYMIRLWAGTIVGSRDTHNSMQSYIKLNFVSEILIVPMNHSKFTKMECKPWKQK